MTEDWTAIHEFLQPKQSEYWVETPSLTQKVFLRSNAKEVLFGGAAGGGKAQDVNTPIPTPNGFKLLEDVHPGDEIFGRDGLPYYVLAESEIHQRPAYRILFDDGSTVDAADDHLWLTYDARELEALTRRSDEFRAKRRETRESRATGSQGERKSLAVAERNRVESFKNRKPAPTGTVRTTQEIVDTLTVRNGRANHAIPVAAPIQLPDRYLPIDPYTLGAWLGDGSSYHGWICGEDPEIWDECAYPIKSVRRSEASNPDFAIVTFDGLYGDLRRNGLLNNKHIPYDYLWASEEQRLALLQGLMDTDGNVSKSSVEFVNTNQNLVEGVAHLARSLGMKVNVREGRSKLNGNDHGPKWMVKFAANRVVFRLPRKAQAQKIATRRTTKFRYIKGVEILGTIDVKCIQVSSPDHLFLCGTHFIPTHNSSALLMAALQYVDVPGYTAILFRRTFADLALPGALMDRFRQWMGAYPEVKWNYNTYTATFPSGARVTFGYLNNKDDYLRYKCSTPDTEVLTDHGWVPIADVSVGDSVMSMDPETREASLQRVTHTHVYDYDGDLVTTRARSDVSFAVTPNHTVLHSTQRNSTILHTMAKDLPKRPLIPQEASIWHGDSPDDKTFEAGSRGQDIRFSPADWATFLGWFISEGNCGNYNGRWEVNVTQTDIYPDHVNNIVTLLESSGANVHRHGNKISFNNANAVRWLQKNVGSGSKSKRIPREAFTWSTKYCQLLIDALLDGDGTWRDPDHRSGHYVTTSKDLADDVMELATRCGYRSTLLRQPYNKKHHFVEDGESWHVFLLRSGKDTATYIETIPYKGKVHGLTVPPHHTYMIRHNGRVCFTGNSAEFQFVGMDEVTEIREFDYTYLFSRIRRPQMGPLANVPLRMRAATNPSPNWVRQRFIVEGKDKGRIFIPSTLDDNPGVEHESYRGMLSELTPVERRRLEFGDWWATNLGSMFKAEDFVTIGSEELPTFDKRTEWVRFWDLAGTEVSENNKDPDWTAGVLMAFHQGICYIIDVRRIRAAGADVEKFIVDTALADGINVPIRMEEEPGSAGKSLVSHYSRNVLPGYDFVGQKATGDKETRAKPMSAAVFNGNVHIVRASWNTDYKEEMGSFPEASVHDDMVDASVHGFNHVTGLGGGLRRKVEIIV